MNIAIVGAGLAGLACATRLVRAGHAVRLFDKGRAPGGRMSTRRTPTPAGEASFDHGAQYFTVRDPLFHAQVDAWAQAGLVARWPAAGPEAWVGTPAMNTPMKQLADGLDVRSLTRIDALSRDGAGWLLRGESSDAVPFDAVVVAIPAEQAGPLLAPWQAAWSNLAAATPALPCWTVMAAFAGPVPLASDVLTEQGPIGWAARNSAKPGRHGPEAWVIQAGPDWSKAHLEDDAATVTAALLEAFAARVDATLPERLSVSAHRWRFAKSGRAGEEALWDGNLRLGVCGDWLLGPRVECAWVSGTRLADAIGS